MGAEAAAARPGATLANVARDGASGVASPPPGAIPRFRRARPAFPGGLGAKFQRALVSEIVGIDVTIGVKTASRIDPAGIQTKAGPIYKHKDPSQDWTVDPKEAETKSGKPVGFSRSGGGDGKKGSPSAINHGNIFTAFGKERAARWLS